MEQKLNLRVIIIAALLGACLVMPTACSQKTADNNQTPEVAAEPEVQVAAAENEEQITADGEVQSEVNRTLPVDLENLSFREKSLFDLVAYDASYGWGMSKDDILAGTITVEEADEMQNNDIEFHILNGNLPENGLELFAEYKEASGYYSGLEPDRFHSPKETIELVEEPSAPQAPSHGNAPKPTQQQQLQQIENNAGSSVPGPENNWDGFGSQRALVEAKYEFNGWKVVSEEEFIEACSNGATGRSEMLSDYSYVYAIKQ